MIRRRRISARFEAAVNRSGVSLGTHNSRAAGSDRRGVDHFQLVVARAMLVQLVLRDIDGVANLAFVFVVLRPGETAGNARRWQQRWNGGGRGG